jgi:transposase
MKMTKLDIENVLIPLTQEDLKSLSRSDLEKLFLGEQELRIQAFKKWEERYCVEGRYIILKRRFYLPSSEKSPPSKKIKNNKKAPNGVSGKKKLLPSERYPQAEIIDKDVVLETPLVCELCQVELKDTGLRDVSEMLTVIPKKFIIERHHHPKLKCDCCQSMVTVPRVPRIKPGSTYSDEMIIDVAMSKYCDLLPMERYAAMAGREGFMGLPPQSLIELTHYLAFFVGPLVEKIKKEIFADQVLRADETPHRMMEQMEKKQWYLWGFSTLRGAYFECHPSRSGDVAADILKQSQCRYLVTDDYSGYGKAIRLANELREEGNKILEVFCNAHARRKFKEQEDDINSQFFLRCYQKIYHLEKGTRSRVWQDRYFRAMKRKAFQIKKDYPGRSGLIQAANYFLSNYEGLTLFLTVEGIPLDNNHQERLMRSPVVGRKTWLGTHSILGGQTAAILFTIVESCKLNKINPRIYLQQMIKNIHQGKEIFTPFEAKRDFPQIFSPD